MSSSLDDLEPFEIFQNELDEYLKEYLKYISSDLPPTALLQQSFVINSFIEYICFHHAISNFESLTLAMATSDFCKWLNQAEEEKLPEKTIKKILKDYLEFLYKTKGIGNVEVLKELKV